MIHMHGSAAVEGGDSAGRGAALSGAKCDAYA